MQDALEASGLRQGMVAVVLVSLGATPPSWSTGISVLGPNDAGEGLVIDTLAHEVSLRGLPVALTMKEFALLQYLYERRGILVSREELLRDVWGGSYNGGRAYGRYSHPPLACKACCGLVRNRARARLPVPACPIRASQCAASPVAALPQ